MVRQHETSQPSTNPASDRLIHTLRLDARAIFTAGLRAADPTLAVLRHCRRQDPLLRIGRCTYDLSKVERLWVVGAGKATAAMAQAIEQIVGERIDDGLISVKEGHGLPLRRIRTIEAGHPLPDARGLMAARQILQMASQAGPRDLMIVLLSGGASALLPLPVARIGLAEKQIVTQLLLTCGAPIHDINAVRKHLSAIKGGRLALAAGACAMATLILSDVVGDDIGTIASGPTVPDPSTFADCLAILQRYHLASKIPVTVMDYLSGGASGHQPETAKAHDFKTSRGQHLIVGGNLASLQAAATQAQTLGYTPLILSSQIQGETRVAAQLLTSMAREVCASGHPLPPPACLLAGGETTVTVKGGGHGGRNQEFALAAALEIADRPNIVVLSAGSDGTDGATEAAGAIVDHTTVERAAGVGLDARSYLDNNDAYTFFSRSGDLLVTGPTGTNIMDLQVMLIRPPEAEPPHNLKDTECH